MSRVLLTGLGYVGGDVLHVLACTPGITEIIATDIDEKKEAKTKNAVYEAAALGLYPNIRFKKLDLKDVEETARFLSEVQPDLIFNSSCLHPFWKFEEDLPPDKSHKITEASRVGFCAALPWRLILPYKLMRAVKESGIKTHVLISNDPCEVINPMLAKVGLAPTAGIGDFAHAIQPIRRAVTVQLKVPMQSVKVYFIGHHSTLHLFQRRIIPPRLTYYLKVMVEDKEITRDWKAEDILLAAVGGSRTPDGRFTIPIGHEHRYTASIVVGDMLALLNDTGEIRHCPGPAGQLGGYPVRLSAKGAEIFLPEGIALNEAIRMHEEAQKAEGIEEIREDGTVVLTDEAVQIIDQVIPWNTRKQFNVVDCEKVAAEYDRIYRKMINKVSNME
jgi:hypothetical protein